MDELASRLDRSKSIISKYECGEINMNIEILFRIADILDISVIQLIDYSENAPSDNAVTANETAYLYLYNKSIKKLDGVVNKNVI